MSTHFNQYIIFLIIGFVCLSCVTEFDLGIENNQQKIVVQSYINPDSLVKVNVTGSIAFLSDQNIEVLEEAQVILYENGLIGEQLQLDDGSNQFVSQSFKPVAGNDYKVIVTYNEESVSGETRIPAKTTIQSINIDTTSVIVKDENKYYKFSLSFKDDEFKENFYEVILFRRWYYQDRFVFVERGDTLRDTTFVRDSFSDLNIEAIEDKIYYDQTSPGVLLADESFAGSLYTFEFLVPAFLIKKRGYAIEEIDIYIALRTITKEMYEFELTANRQGWIIDNPFATPLPVTGNILNGLGVFAGYNQDVIKIEIR